MIYKGQGWAISVPVSTKFYRIGYDEISLSLSLSLYAFV
jgi:hypothetical protein